MTAPELVGVIQASFHTFFFVITAPPTLYFLLQYYRNVIVVGRANNAFRKEIDFTNSKSSLKSCPVSLHLVKYPKSMVKSNVLELEPIDEQSPQCLESNKINNILPIIGKEIQYNKNRSNQSYKS